MAGLTCFIGTRLLKGIATWGELLRTLGFATAPGILSILSIASITPVAVVVAIRQALRADVPGGSWPAWCSGPC